ncbi:MAG: bis(5'-nucleosyl)-tetraphosphatase (symmetrical) YqeK [Candidatus Obscuribacterales bacterium]|nr:bis(5'-nucleosyl)-tetraphosphatase (symmetrical) YqeK [Candidatus Obscuribacterales bacterium]
MPKYEGIPESLTLMAARQYVEPRVSEKRFAHIEGVAKFAKRIASACGVDPFLAELSGWLHDACKHVKDKELVAMADKFGMELHPVDRQQGRLIHGPVAAYVCREELGLTNKDVLDAITEHTLGNVPMSDLSKVTFLADCLEESRPDNYRKPILDALDLDGKVNLNKAMLVALDLGLQMLISDKAVIHPRTVDCRNYFLDLVRNANK